MKVAILFLLLGLATALPNRMKPRLDKWPRIIGGNPATPGQFPYQASFQRLDYSGNYCGGSIIASHWVVTAAHCVEDLGTLSAWVRVGSLEWATGGQRIAVSRVYISEQWDSFGLAWDYALLELAAPITFNNLTQPIRIAPPTVDPVNHTCWISGWGRLDHGSSPYPAVMHGARASAITDTQCQSIMEEFGVAWHNDAHVCIWNQQTTTCNADSGGPLACEVGGVRELFGATSFGISSFGNNCMLEYPAGFGQLNSQVVRDWIRTTCGNCIA